MTQIKTFITTKAEYLDEKVNKWFEENSPIVWYEITPYLSYTSIKDKGSYMVGCTIIFKKEEPDGIPT